MDRARIYQGILGWPATSAFKTYVNNNLILNCSITVYDLNIAEDMYVEARPILQGKNRRKKPTVHSKIEKCLCLFQYQRDTKTYIYAWTFFT